MKSFKPRHAAFVAALSVALGVFAFACGSNDDVQPNTCEGATCIDGGGTESSTKDGPSGDDAKTSTDGGADADAGGDSSFDAGEGGALLWAQSYGKTGYVFPGAVALDPANGDVAVAGYYTGTVDFGGGTLASQGTVGTGFDTFVARFNKDGAYKWAKTFGTGALATAHGAAVDGSGNVLVGGNFTGSVNFGGATLAAVGDVDLFLVEFDAAGNHRWSKSFGTPGQVQVLDTAAVDSAGNVLIAGIASSLDFGGGSRTGFYAAKFDSMGAYKWSNAFAATSGTSSPVLGVDGAGNVVLAGSFENTADFGAGTFTAMNGQPDGFIVKFNASEAYQWAKQYGNATGHAPIYAFAVSNAGDIFIAGNHRGVVNFGQADLTSPDSSKGYYFLAEINTSGNGVWSKQFVASGTANQMPPQSMAVNGLGGPTVAFLFRGTTDFGGGLLTGGTGCPPDRGGCVAIASFDGAGGYRWSYAGEAPSATSSSGAIHNGVAASGSRVLIVGQFGYCPAGSCSTSPPGTTLVLAGKTLTAASAADVFLASLTP